MGEMGEHERVFNFLNNSSGSPNFIGLDLQTSLLPGGQSFELIWRLVLQAGAAGISISALRDAINPEMVRIFGRTMKPKWLTQYLELLPSTFVLDTTSDEPRTFVRLTSGALAFEGEGEQRTQPRLVPKQRTTPTVTVTPSPRADVAPPRDETPCADDEPRCRYLRFSNLPHGCSSDELETLLEPLGKVEEVQVARASGGGMLALVEMSCTREATSAKRRLNEMPLRGSTMTVVFDSARSRNEPSTQSQQPQSSAPPEMEEGEIRKSALFGSSECGAAESGAVVYEKGYTDGWYAGHQAAAEDIWRNAEYARVQLQKELDEAHEVERTKMIETMKQHYRQALAMQVGQGVNARVARMAREQLMEQHQQHSSAPSAPSESLMKAAAAAADAAADAAIAAADAPMASDIVLSAAAHATGKRQLGLGLDAAATPCFEDLGQSSAQETQVYGAETAKGAHEDAHEDLASCGELLLCGTASYEESVAKAPPGASAGSAGKFKKRTVAGWMRYEAYGQIGKKADSKANGAASGADGGAKAATASSSGGAALDMDFDDFEIAEFETADQLHSASSPLVGAKAMTAATTTNAAAARPEAKGDAHDDAIEEQGAPVKRPRERPRDDSEEPRHSSTAAQTHTTVPSPKTERLHESDEADGAPKTERAVAGGRSVVVSHASDYGPSLLDEERNQHAIRNARIPSLLAPAPVTLTLALTRRLLAFRQYLEMRRLCVGVKSSTKPWQLRVRRGPFLVADVLEHFGYGQRREKPERVLKQLYSLTSVTFIDPRTGREEEGDDLGGLTRELYSLFWREVLREEHGLFERAVGNDSPGGSLPRPSAPPEALEAVGRVLLKCIIDDHPIGHGVCPFLLDQLVHGDAGAASELGCPASALRALATFDASLAESWRQLLEAPEQHLAGLTYEDFDPGAPEIHVPPAAFGEAIRMGVTQRLLTSRAGAFAALRRGAHGVEDLTVQLATVGSSDELSFLLQGKREVSAHELLECFTLPRTSAHEEAAAGFAAVGSEVPSYLEALLLDETVFGPEERLALLRWCTALAALPMDGLGEQKITLRLYGDEADDATLPETHTCTRELHLPNYSSAEVLQAKLLLAIEHIEDGFLKA